MFDICDLPKNFFEAAAGENIRAYQKKAQI